MSPINITNIYEYLFSTVQQGEYIRSPITSPTIPPVLNPPLWGVLLESVGLLSLAVFPLVPVGLWLPSVVDMPFVAEAPFWVGLLP